MFKSTAQDGMARCGSLLIGSKASVLTPAPMLYARRGSSVFLTTDMLDKLRPEAQMVQISALQFLNQPTPDVLRHFGRSIHAYLGLSSWPIFASNRDPGLTEYLSTKPASNTAAYATIHSGSLPVTPERYMEGIAAMQPDMFVALADEITGDAKPKRIALSVDRTMQWLDECIRLRHEHAQTQQQQQQQANGSEQPPQDSSQPPEAADSAAGGAIALFAPVVGGASEAERARSAKAAAERDVAGFALCGFGMGEHFSARPKLLSAALQHLPADKPRVAVGLDTPEDILAAVQQGVDLFDCSYPLQATAHGQALSFPLSPAAAAASAQQRAAGGGPTPPTAVANSNPFGIATAAAAGGEGDDDSSSSSRSSSVDVDAGADDTKLNLWALKHRLDKGPLVQGCSCFTCQNHSRAYIHHLLHTHEMLAGVLLEMHNTHWWLGFFAAIREAVQQGQLQQYVDWFSQRRTHMQQQPQPSQQQQQELDAAAEHRWTNRVH